MSAAPSLYRFAGLRRGVAVALMLAVVTPSPAAAADALGRLFFTPQQRQELDRRRQANIVETAITQESLVTVNGRVSRASGKSTNWINGVPQADSHATQDPARVTIGGGEGEPQAQLKVGQTLDRNQGEIKGELGGGKILVPSRGKR